MLERFARADCARDAALMEEDCAFSVLAHALRGTCETILTDHRRLVVCHTGGAFPVWMWLPDDADARELRAAWRIAREAFPPENGFRYNVAPALADCLRADGLIARQTMLAYRCEHPIAPRRTAAGRMRPAQSGDVEQVAAWMMHFRREVGMDEAPMMRCRIEARALIESGRLKLWQDGESCAMCAVRVDGKNACLTHVYTPPEHRRQGYAAQLAYTVTRDALARGLRAMLYADADYAASNACYAGLGYAPQGTIYTLQKP